MAADERRSMLYDPVSARLAVGSIAASYEASLLAVTAAGSFAYLGSLLLQIAFSAAPLLFDCAV